MLKVKAGLIGKDILDSKSPIIHKLLSPADCELEYELYDCDLEEYDDFVKEVNEIFDSGCQYLSVTAPYKKWAANMVGHTHGSVNCLWKVSDRIIGSSTDGLGFEIALEALGSKVEEDYSLKHIVILGDGGAARAIIDFFEDFFNHHRFEIHLIRDIRYINERDIQLDYLKDCNLLVNTVPVFDRLILPEDNLFENNPIVIDITATKQDTVLLQKARDRKLLNDNGIRMLVAQAMLFQSIWFGKNYPDCEPSYLNNFIEKNSKLLNYEAY